MYSRSRRSKHRTTRLPRPAQVVVLSQVLACDATLGYEELYNVQVLRFNGEPVRNLRHLAQLCLACAAPFMRFDLDYDVRCPPAPACLPARAGLGLGCASPVPRPSRASTWTTTCAALQPVHACLIMQV